MISFFLFVVVRIVNAFHEDLAVVNLISHCQLQQSANLGAIQTTRNHRIKIIPFVYLAPVHTLFHTLLEDKVKPDTDCLEWIMQVILPPFAELHQ